MGVRVKTKYYHKNKKGISCFELINQLVQLKKEKETSWLSEVYSQSLQQSIINLDKAFTSFFNKNTQFPKFKSKHNNQSFQYPQNVKVDFNNSTVKLPKIGEVKAVFSRKFKGKIKTCTISKTRTNKYFISILVETKDKPKKKFKVVKSKAVGVDLGIKDFLITSNGEKVDSPKYLRSSEKRLKVLQRRASKKKKGSNNRKKANLSVAKKHEKIRNRREDFLHKISTRLIRENKTICLEDLNVAGMIKNHKLAKSIADASWSKFVNMLTYKAEWYGVNLLFIGRFDPSSKMCSKCGSINEDLTLKDRKWKCKECNIIHDRDINAAMNIKNFAFNKQNTNSGSGRPGDLLEMLVRKPKSMKEESV